MARASLYQLRFLPHERRYALMRDDVCLTPEMTTSRQRWEEWLATITSFAFEDQQGRHCTVRQERLRRGETYWYAYRSIQGHTKKRYLGKTADLSLERLEKVSAAFTSAAPESTPNRIEPEPQALSALPLLETKLHPPRLALTLIERPRLLEQLDASLVHRLTLLLAPAGSGKTTQVNQWLTAHSYQAGVSMERRVAWVSLDAGDNDPVRFWRYVMTACQRLLGQDQQDAGQSALALLTMALQPPFDTPPIDVALTHLLNALAAPASGGLLVLDDYHAIHETHIHEQLTFFIDHLPTSIHILLIARAEPDLPLLRWRARGDLHELRTVDLRFSSEETASFLRQTLPVEPSAQVLSQLERSLEGWAAGLRLLALTLAGWRDPYAIEQALLSLGERADLAQPGRATRTDSPRQDLLDYFVHELLETQPAPIQRFLLQTSVLNRLCAPLCATLIGREDSEEQLETATRAGLFLEAMVGPGGWYRYHALFAEAMRREASRRLGEEALRSLSLRASYWYEHESLLVEAIDAAWLAHDLERMARLIEQFNEQHFYEPYTLRHWLEQLPEAVLREYPTLCILFATELHIPAQIRFSPTSIPESELVPIPAADRERGTALLQMAEEGWRRQGKLTWIGAIWAHHALTSMLNHEPISRTASHARQALTFLQHKNIKDQRLRMYRSSSLLFVGTEMLRLGQAAEAQQMLLQARQDNVPPGNRFLASDILLILGKSYLAQGQVQLACHELNHALAAGREINDAAVISGALLGLAWIAFESGDLSTTEQHLNEAHTLVENIQPPEQELHDQLALQLALLRHERGEAQTALQQLAELEPRLTDNFWLTSRLHAWQTRQRTRTPGPQNTATSELVEPLSGQEERVLRLLAAGHSNQEIAQQLVVSVNTIKYHIKHLYQKLGVSNRLQASAAARHLLPDM